MKHVSLNSAPRTLAFVNCILKFTAPTSPDPTGPACGLTLDQQMLKEAGILCGRAAIVAEANGKTETCRMAQKLMLRCLAAIAESMTEEADTTDVDAPSGELRALWQAA